MQNWQRKTSSSVFATLCLPSKAQPFEEDAAPLEQPHRDQQRAKMRRLMLNFHVVCGDAQRISGMLHLAVASATLKWVPRRRIAAIDPSVSLKLSCSSGKRGLQAIARLNVMLKPRRDSVAASLAAAGSRVCLAYSWLWSRCRPGGEQPRVSES